MLLYTLLEAVFGLTDASPQALLCLLVGLYRRLCMKGQLMCVPPGLQAQPQCLGCTGRAKSLLLPSHSGLACVR